MRLLFVGMPCVFSTPSLLALLRAGLEVAAVVVPAPAALRREMALRALPAPPGLALRHATKEPSIVEIARAHRIPVLEVGRLRDPATLAGLRALAPDLVAVACFPHRLPAAWLRLAPLGALNVHPSLLPDNRGPEPLFWTFRRGDAETGVTVHLMTEALDAGPILRQQAVPVPDGIAGRELERVCAAPGGELLVESVRELAAGTARPRPQPAEFASFYPLPADEDFVVRGDRPARWAFNFIRGAASWGVPVIEVDGQRLPVRRALHWSAETTLRRPYERTGSRLRLRCAPGVVDVEVLA